MRPVRLEVEGFTCYRERQSPLSFEGLSLFSIAGPTGAGKSSILDAILFALFGQVPRIGKQGISDVIAQGRDALAVTLDFTVKGGTYRVSRRVKRGRSGGLTSSAILEQLAPAARALAEQVRPVNDEIERLLGLGFSAFTQTVILPQGEFAKFLKADPKEQRAILQHLLRHEIYERMRAEAERRRTRADEAVRLIERTLEATSHATPQRLDAARAALAGGRASVTEFATRKDEEAAAAAALRVAHELTVEVQALRRSLAQLEQAAPVVAARRAELEAARAAAGVVPRIDASRLATERAASATSELQQAETALARARQVASDAEERVAMATAEDATRTGLAARIRALDEIKGDLDRRDQVQRERHRLAGQMPQARQRAHSARTAAGQARDAREEAAGRVAAATTSLAILAFDPDEAQRIESVWETALQLRAVDHETVALERQHQEWQEEVARAARTLSGLDKALAGATRACEAAARAEREARAALDAARTMHQAAAVREHLHVGEACPVCLQTVVLLPPAGRAPELEALGRALGGTVDRLTAATATQQQVAQDRAAAEARLQAARTSAEVAASALRQKVESRHRLVALVVPALAGASDVASPASLVEAVESRRTTMRVARQEHERASKALREAEAALVSADLALVQADGAATSAVDAFEHLAANDARLTAELGEVVKRIAAVSTHDDPAVERRQLAQQLAALEEARREAERVRAEAVAAMAAAGARLASAQSSVDQARAAAADADVALSEALAGSGFSAVQEARAAVRSAAQQAALDQAVRQHETEQGVVTRRLLLLEPQVAGREVSAEALAVAEASADAAFARWREADLDVATKAADLVRLEADVTQRQRDEAEHATEKASLELLSGMASDLKGDAFQEYLLEEAFHALVSGASIRMREMSNRYTLDWDKGAFFVVDHDNAGERRRAETLSGGETFMASLCLALQLSDEVLKTSGALRMDSLFIDEGFGTLDADALAEVTDAMEALRHDGGRLIGVISHRPEITERLPGCVRVVKAAAGASTWVLERVG